MIIRFSVGRLPVLRILKLYGCAEHAARVGGGHLAVFVHVAGAEPGGTDIKNKPRSRGALCKPEG